MNKTCATCPFLEANRDKPTPNDFEWNETDWYSQENIDGVWRNMKLMPVQFLSCHSTDPDYYGKDEKSISACTGGALLVYMHLKIYEKAGSYENYLKTVGEDIAMSQSSLIEKGFAITVGRTSPLWGGMLLPTGFKLDLDAIRWPTGFKSTVREFQKILKSKS